MRSYGLERCWWKRRRRYGYILPSQPTWRARSYLTSSPVQLHTSSSVASSCSSEPLESGSSATLSPLLSSALLVGFHLKFHHFTLQDSLANAPFPSHPGAFWLTFGGTLVPSFNAYGAYVTTPAQMAGQNGNPGNPLGLQTPAFNASFAFLLVFMGALDSTPFACVYGNKLAELTNVCVGLVCFIFLICSLRTNIVFFLIFLSLIGSFACLAAAYWNLALAYENAANTMAAKRAGRLIIVSFLPYIPCQSCWLIHPGPR